jgi:CO/xanthine dehydrogenase FAD-binding subunit
VLGAHLVLRSKTGERNLPAESFIQGPGQTVLGKGELLTAVSIPAEGPDIDFFRKVGTRASNALSKLSIAATASVGQGMVKEVRLALGAVAPTVVRSAEAEELMTGKTASQIRRDLYRILDAYNGMIHPIDDQRSSSLYRLKASFRLILSFIGTVLLPAVEQQT